ncbi:penicillin acylase family protein [Roseospira goensis]|uniref:Penicillin amidase n=1 Tax=Roseospira goensis TaxID=391922 RepID=A0A7W6RYC0_9PROT|nr:penicillin acylase family protein [Roseospira goensis]MBB4285397.1 penicillin amidase [Roseospira goensis]
MLKWLGRTLAVLIGLGVGAVVALVGFGVVTVWRTLPPAEATVALGDALAAPVEVIRDAHGIPTIRAQSLRDATVALGYLHAQDRLWQMEAMRRLGAGRMAEVLGAPVVGLDRFMRTLGLYRAAEAQWTILDEETRAAARAYAAGVNALIADPPGGLPVAFRLAFHAPEPWTPVDSMVWQRFMGLQLSGNWHDELLTLRLLGRFDRDAVTTLMRTEPEARPAITTAAAGVPTPTPLPDAVLARLAAATPAPVRPTLASNAWAVAPPHTASGGAMLASDPHLGYQAPIRWYLVRIETPDGVLEGATVPGVPFVVIGHNGRLAWGFTTTHSDTIDLYRERVSGGGATYERPGGPVAFVEREETIRVRFGADETVRVRQTVHGPVVSDLGWGPMQAAMQGPAGSEVLALAAAALYPDDTTPDALRRLNRAGSLDEARAALALWDAPQQNILLADADGRIAMVSPGRVPARAPGHFGLIPAEGWTGAMDWLDWVPRAALPETIDPPAGRVLNANNRIHPPGVPMPMARQFPEPYRAARLAARLAQMPAADVDAMAALQMDAVSPMAADLLPLLLEAAAAGTPRHAEAPAALAALRAWTPPVMDAAAPEPLIAAVWMETLTARLFRDDLGEAYDAWARRPRPLPVRQAVTEDRDWCDDRTTPASETCAAVVAAALDDTLAWIADETGGPALEARWGDVHRARIRHELFRYVPGVAWLTGMTAPVDGGPFTLNRGGHSGLDGSPPFAHVHGAGLRAVIDFGADPAGGSVRGRYVIATGQSGNPLSPHYRDQFEPWRRGVLLEIGAGAPTGTLTLTP